MMGTQQRKPDHNRHNLHHLHNLHHHQQQQQQGVIQSSIALLQERFKQLQRVKEMREKRELLRIFSNDHNPNNIDQNNNNNTTTSATILSTSTTTTTDTPNNLNPNNIIPRDSPMQHTHHHQHESYDGDHVSDEKELQVFLPLNYYNCKPSPCHSSPPPFSSSQSSPSSSSTASPSTSWSSSPDSNKEVALSLWPYTPPCKITAVNNNNNINPPADPFQRTTTMISRGCISKGFRFEDTHHVSDVDTTLHL